MTHAEKLADWKTRRPVEYARLEKAICRRLGMRRGITSELAREAVEQWAAAMCAAMLNWPDEPEPADELPTPGGVSRAEVTKALDLTEYPDTGRDKAAGVERD